MSSAKSLCHEIQLKKSNEGKVITLLGSDVIPNFRRVNSYLYRGGQPNLDNGGLEALHKDFGITTIINLIGSTGEETLATIEREKNDWKKLTGNKGRFIHIPQKNYRIEMLKEESVDSMFSVLVETLQSRDRGEKVFIHCKGGRDRTGLAVATVRVFEGCGAAKAVDEFLNNDGQPYRAELKWEDINTAAGLYNSYVDTREPSAWFVVAKTLSLESFNREFLSKGLIFQLWNKQCRGCLHTPSK